MKNTILLFSAMLFTTFGFAQIKVVAPNGDVGIGESNPAFKLEVSDALTANSSPVAVFNNTGTANGFGLVSNASSSGNANIGLFVSGAPKGNIGYDVSRNFLGFLNQAFTASDFQLRLNGIGGLEFHNPTNGPAAEFQINSSGQVGIRVAPNANADLALGGPTAIKVGGGTWSPPSDKRLKKNVTDYDGGLKEVLKLHPVNFTYNGKGGVTDTETEFVGVIAQEVKKIAPYMIGSFEYTEINYIEDEGNLGGGNTMRYKSSEGKTEEYLSVDPNAFTYMLINAVKEQQFLIEQLQDRLNDIEGQTGGTITNPGTPTQQLNFVADQNAASSLEQNNPNPFNGTTTIEYFIAENSVNNILELVGNNGETLKTFTLSNAEKGPGKISLNIENLPSGTYFYRLVVDSKVIDTKKMNIVN